MHTKWKRNASPSPPPYDQPPAYRPPEHFTIGSKTFSMPLVQTNELKAHLCLLRAFKILREAVEVDDVTDWPETIRMLDRQQRWAWFVGLAIDRFQSWVRVVGVSPLDQWIAQEMPPLDVLMVWHAYMLNPSWYAEDLIRVPNLSFVGALKGTLLAAIVRVGDISTYEPPTTRKTSWFQQTGTPFDPRLSASTMVAHIIKCPHCLKNFSAPYITPDGAGYLQSKFRTICPLCNFPSTRESLAVFKLANDITLDPNSAQDAETFGAGVYLAGTVRTVEKDHDERMASTLKSKVQAVFPPPKGSLQLTRDEWAKNISAEVAHRMGEIQKKMVTAFNGNVRRTKHILSAYTDDSPFSVDLVGAVVRQGSFIDKMHKYGWTEPKAFDGQEDAVVLLHCIARYHAFLDLMSSAPGSFFVPTLDIDLAWHTHQLKSDKYQADCMEHVQRYIDHDDKVEEDHLATSFDVTCRAWEARFQLPYTYCGCPFPGDTIGQRLARMKHHLKGTCPSTGLVPPLRSDALAGTHASEHNGVYMPTQTPVQIEAARKAREAQVQKRLERDGKEAKKKNEVYLEKTKEVLEATDHIFAFLEAIPFPNPPSCGCVAPSGCSSQTGAGCAVGAGACSGSGCGGAGCAGGGCGGGGGGGSGGGGGHGGSSCGGGGSGGDCGGGGGC